MRDYAKAYPSHTRRHARRFIKRPILFIVLGLLILIALWLIHHAQHLNTLIHQHALLPLTLDLTSPTPTSTPQFQLPPPHETHTTPIYTPPTPIFHFYYHVNASR